MKKKSYVDVVENEPHHMRNWFIFVAGLMELLHVIALQVATHGAAFTNELKLGVGFFHFAELQ